MISDTGPGIDPLVRKQVFDLFFTTTTKGTGIGLSVVKDAAISHGGDILVDTASTPGATHSPILGITRFQNITTKMSLPRNNGYR